jgi:hypothetical protein
VLASSHLNRAFLDSDRVLAVLKIVDLEWPAKNDKTSCPRT